MAIEFVKCLFNVSRNNPMLFIFRSLHMIIYLNKFTNTELFLNSGILDLQVKFLQISFMCKLCQVLTSMPLALKHNLMRKFHSFYAFQYLDIMGITYSLKITLGKLLAWKFVGKLTSFTISSLWTFYVLQEQFWQITFSTKSIHFTQVFKCIFLQQSMHSHQGQSIYFWYDNCFWPSKSSP